MKQLTDEDCAVLSKLFKAKDTELLVLQEGNKLNNTKTFSNVSELNNFLKQFPYGEFTIANLSGQKLTAHCQKEQVWAIWNFGKSSARQKGQDYEFVNNPDGTIRWLYPSEAKKPLFLNLYNGNGLRAKIVCNVIKIAWILGSRKLTIGGKFSVWSKVQLPVHQYTKGVSAGYWSLFTGTIGTNRKLVMEINDGEKTKHFLKIPISDKAKKNVDNEYQQLMKLEQFALRKSEVPTSKKVVDAILLKNIKPENFKNKSKLCRLHLDALYEWYNRSSKGVKGYKLPQLSEIRNCLDRINKVKMINNGISIQQKNKITNQLEELYESVKHNDQYIIGLTHGDFTPWNLFLSETKIHVYDWELASDNFPILFDAFHFVFQAGVLIDKVEYKTIHQRLNNLKNNSIVKAICSQYSVDFDSHKEFYLLYNISYYLDLYLQQSNLHNQVNWLIDCWSNALDALENNQNRDLKTKLYSQYGMMFPISVKPI